MQDGCAEKSFGVNDMRITCCKGCVAPKRYPGCHDRCPEYIEQKAQFNAEKEAQRKKKQISFGITAQRAAAVTKAIKSRRNSFRMLDSRKGAE